MNTVIDEMLKNYVVKDKDDQINVAKEILQEIILCGLSRAKFFDKAAFYGGTALRLFHGLNRFSEDLDFSLKKPDLQFRLEQYFPALIKEVESYGLRVQFEEKKKTADSKVLSAFLKGNTLEHMLFFYGGERSNFSIPANQVIKVKFEVDIDPPPLAEYEYKMKLLPMPHEVMLYDLPSLFAGKLHAVICRAWKHRTKGRDLFDYVFYLQKGAKINMPHLHAKLLASKAIQDSDRFDMDMLKSMLNERFENIDYESAKGDVFDFVSNKQDLSYWSPSFFQTITKEFLKE